MKSPVQYICLITLGNISLPLSPQVYRAIALLFLLRNQTWVMLLSLVLAQGPCWPKAFSRWEHEYTSSSSVSSPSTFALAFVALAFAPVLALAFAATWTKDFTASPTVKIHSYSTSLNYQNFSVIQRCEKRLVNFVKQDPGRVRQNS